MLTRIPQFLNFLVFIENISSNNQIENEEKKLEADNSYGNLLLSYISIVNQYENVLSCLQIDQRDF